VQAAELHLGCNVLWARGASCCWPRACHGLPCQVLVGLLVPLGCTRPASGLLTFVGCCPLTPAHLACAPRVPGCVPRSAAAHAWRCASESSSSRRVPLRSGRLLLLPECIPSARCLHGKKQEQKGKEKTRNESEISNPNCSLNSSWIQTKPEPKMRDLNI